MNDKRYDHIKTEPRWRHEWEKNATFYPKSAKRAKNPFYNLWMFPYPSAEGVHVGTMFSSTGSDVYGRFQRMQGKEVFQPIGYDSFGIHSENYAIKIGESPQKMLSRTIPNYERQLKSIGHGYDWTRTVTTSDIDYYIWTQWLVRELFKAGLAYKKKASVNWCPGCKTVLADEQIMTPAQAGKLPKGYDKIEDVPEGIRVCERCGSIPETKELEQWFLRITDYAERLLSGLDKIDWSERVVIAQRNWIGKKRGIKISYDIVGQKEKIDVFTTAPVNFGMTFMALAPEYPLVDKILKGEIEIPVENLKQVREYVEDYLKKEKGNLVRKKTKTGVFTGLYITNPVDNRQIPVWISNFVLMTVGTGAVQGCPGHDYNDFEFAKKYNLPIIRVIVGADGDKSPIKEKEQVIEHGNQGKFVNSKFLDGLEFEDGLQKTMDWFEKKGLGERNVHYHLRDWLISRQRYWGAPIPMVYCEKCAKEGKSYFTGSKARLLHKDQNDWQHAGWYVEDKLPIELPEIKDYKPEGQGRGPLANHPEFYKTKCPACGSPAMRETDVMDTFVDSSWYFLRYPSVNENPKSETPWSPDVNKTWLPVDLYFGGAEHSVLHLMYSRFVTMALHDLGHFDFEEPFPKFYAHGLMIKDGAKMSKSRGNVVNPDEYIEKFGADTLRLYLMFMGPMDGYPDFRDSGIEGMRRFVERVWGLFANGSLEVPSSGSGVESQHSSPISEREIKAKMHQTIKRVTEDIKLFKYNTAISAIMEYVNFLRENLTGSASSAGSSTFEALKTLCLLLAPFAPHMCEEIWVELLGQKFSVHRAKWPTYDEKYIHQDQITMVVQVNGKVRASLILSSDIAKEKKAVEDAALKDDKIAKWLDGKKVKNVVFVPGKIINFVTSNK